MKTDKKELIHFLQQILLIIRKFEVDDFKCSIEYGIQEKVIDHNYREYKYNGKRHICIDIDLRK